MRIECVCYKVPDLISEMYCYKVPDLLVREMYCYKVPDLISANRDVLLQSVYLISANREYCYKVPF